MRGESDNHSENPSVIGERRTQGHAQGIKQGIRRPRVTGTSRRIPIRLAIVATPFSGIAPPSTPSSWPHAADNPHWHRSL